MLQKIEEEVEKKKLFEYFPTDDRVDTYHGCHGHGGADECGKDVEARPAEEGESATVTGYQLSMDEQPEKDPQKKGAHIDACRSYAREWPDIHRQIEGD